MIKACTDDAWDDLVWLFENDRRMYKRVVQLIRDIERDPFSRLGKPEPLRYGLSGTWSRRIDGGNRLVYSVEGDVITIYSARDHYR